jgi:hypothetical protein
MRHDGRRCDDVAADCQQSPRRQHDDPAPAPPGRTARWRNQKLANCEKTDNLQWESVEKFL